MVRCRCDRPDHETHDGGPDQDDQDYQEGMDRIQAEYQREEFYLCGDYLHALEDGQSPPVSGNIQGATERSESPRTVFPQTKADNSEDHTTGINKEEKMYISPEDRASVVHYCYRITDFCDCPKEIAAIAMNFFDRFLSNSIGWSWLESVHEKQRGTFLNLIFLTCLFLAMKLHGPVGLRITTVAALSRGKFTVAQVEYMEFLIMNALGWRLHPPTPLAFVRHMLDFPSDQDDYTSSNDEVYNLAKLVLEMAVVDYSFVTERPSTLAFCSIIIALQSLRQTSKKELLEITIANAIPSFDQHSDHVHLVQDKLCLGVASQYLHLNMNDLAVEPKCDSPQEEDKNGDGDSDNFTPSTSFKHMTSTAKASHRQRRLDSQRSDKAKKANSESFRYTISSSDENSVIEANGSFDSVVDFSVYWI